LCHQNLFRRDAPSIINARFLKMVLTLSIFMIHLESDP
jgi:hypothetical protein